MDGKEPKHLHQVNLNEMLIEDPTPFKLVAMQENVNHRLVKEEIDQAEASRSELCAYTKAPNP